ncbi:DUF647-domain-containing protein [Plenodomus tracheiphilus IPT5]|uniref:DUF647-domain-containing protein n=1 Tax=Plenodomus tracheiphilus IPT5 TaxID=1408161 RepID=A0A6A7B067_9PLEO|nr:DUF647-domain-containing protein [Plenodomus tracheiphilus IPT5]
MSPINPPTPYQIKECDEAGNTTATYISQGGARVDIIHPQTPKSYTQQLLEIFLPAGFPHSVSEDYVQYQIYDSLQAFSSSIAGMLASRAVLEGFGVGNPTASPTSALLLTILQSTSGRIATILFAHRLGTALEPECKMYRLAADIFNDTAMVLDCLSPAFPKQIRVCILSLGGVLRALCGVCAGSAKASLSAHFATRGNLGEVNAKDSSQETVISLLGMLAGSVVVSCISSPMATWSTLIALLSIHLATNYAAVKAVRMRCLNRQRANIVMSNLVQHGEMLGPSEVARRERVFERDGALRWSDDVVVGYCRIGVSLQTLLSRIGLRNGRTGSLQLHAVAMSELLDVFVGEAYILWPASFADEVLIVLKQGCTPMDQLRAWTHALSLAKRRPSPLGKPGADNASLAEDRLAEVRRTLADTRALFEKYSAAMRDAGWDLDVAALETRAGTRVRMEEAQKR